MSLDLDIQWGAVDPAVHADLPANGRQEISATEYKTIRVHRVRGADIDPASLRNFMTCICKVQGYWQRIFVDWEILPSGVTGRH